MNGRECHAYLTADDKMCALRATSTIVDWMGAAWCRACTGRMVLEALSDDMDALFRSVDARDGRGAC